MQTCSLLTLSQLGPITLQKNLNIQTMPFMLSKNEHRKVRVNNRHFVLISNSLYGRSVDKILRQCVNYHKVASILEACRLVMMVHVVVIFLNA
jgi:hypothetical protein